MNTILNTSKRKKIRKRKLLNEIRNRSRRFIHTDTISKGSDEMGNNRKNYNFVTTNRLTLQMFPNAVRSETVTRYGNEVKNNSNINLKDLMPYRETLSINTEMIDNESCVSENNCQNISHHKVHKSDINTEIESPEVFSEFHKESSILQPPHHDTHVTSSLTDTSEDNCIHDKYYLYEQFMSTLPGYLKRTFPSSLFRDDVIKNLKAQLLNIKIQSNSNNILPKYKVTSDIHVSDTSEDLMVEDPKDYIRLGYTALQNSPSQQSECSTGTSDSVDSFLHLHSPHLISSSSRTDISDTPEYIYFPHKLN